MTAHIRLATLASATGLFIALPGAALAQTSDEQKRPPEIQIVVRDGDTRCEPQADRVETLVRGGRDQFAQH